MYSFQRVLLFCLISLVGCGCTSSASKVATEPCVTNPLVNIDDDTINSNLELGYFADNSYYIIGSDAKNKTLLTNGIHPYWSPDKKRFAYKEENEICLANSDGSQIVRITDGNLLISDIVWSPSGKYLAYTVNYKDEQDLLGSSYNGEIYIASTDGNIVRLTNSPASSDNNLSWSPDEKMIAFDSYADPVDTGGYIVYTVSISIVNLADRKSTVITTDGLEPIWYPDGKQLLFESIDNQICRIDLKGQNRVCITSGYYDYAAQFSPDGQHVAFTRIDKDWSIYIMKPDGTEQVWLANGIFPIWSPDGSQIAFSTGGDHADLYVIYADGTNLTYIANNAWGYTWVNP